MRALFLTPSARAWLAQTTAARVLSSFDQACNLINQDDALLALVTSELRLNPFAMLVAAEDAAPFQTLGASSPVRISAHTLVIDSLLISFDAAEVWDPRPDWMAVRATLAPASWLAELSNMALAFSTRPSLLDLYRAGPARSTREGALLARARHGARTLIAGIGARSPEQCRAGVQSLAGLGNGLTPAGDDFIVGIILALWAGLFGEATDLCPSIAEAVAPRTHPLSAAYVWAAARGECSRHWHMLLRAISEYNRAKIRTALQAMLTVGHSSGADALAGFIAARHLVLEPNTP